MNSRKITAAVLTLFVLVASAFSGPIGSFRDLTDAVEAQLESRADASGDPQDALDAVSKSYDDSFWKRELFLRGNGLIAKVLGMRGYYSDLGIYVYDNGYIISPTAKTSTDFEIEQMKRLAAVCAEEKVPLLYVNAPRKYLDDTVFNRFGMESYVNRNADLFLSRLASETDVPYIDLRERITAENWDSFSLFYRTDHHWTTRTGLWAAGIIASGLNAYCGLGLDLSLIAEDQFTFTDYPSAWVGEQGRKISEDYIGRDDYTFIEPKGDNSYVVTDLLTGAEESGSFDIMVNRSVLGRDPAEIGWKSWHYIYFPQYLSYTRIQNLTHPDGKILYLCDSYSYAVLPFLSAGVGDITSVVMRDLSEGFDLLAIVREGDFDAIVIVYAAFMIGAHDNPSSINRNMFAFDPSYTG